MLRKGKAYWAHNFGGLSALFIGPIVLLVGKNVVVGVDGGGSGLSHDSQVAMREEELGPLKDAPNNQNSFS